MITLTGGKSQTLAGVAVPNGSIEFTLANDATVISVGGQVQAGIPVKFSFDSSGNLAGKVQIYSNAELTPSTAYLVNFYDANGTRTNASPEIWQFSQASGVSVDIGTMIPTNAGVSFAQPVLLSPTGNQTIAAGNLTLSAGDFVLAAGHLFKWSDTGLSRTAAGTVAVGNGTQGDTSGTLDANSFLAGPANPLLYFSITPGTVLPGSAQARRGITFASDPAGDVTLWFNSAQNGPGYFFKDGFTGNIPVKITPNTLSIGGATSGFTAITAAAIASGSLQLPTVGTQLISDSATQTLTGKTYDTAGSGNVFKINGTQITAVTGTGSAVLATSPTVAGPTINTGVAQGSGVKHQRFGASCTTAAAVNASCTTTYSWTSAFADANYTVVCVGDTNTNIPILESETHIAASVTVTIIANSAAAASFGAVNCIAIHD